MASSSQVKTMSTTSSIKPYTGKLQHSTTRLPAKPSVDYARGGDDFRTPKYTYRPTCSASIGKAPRFSPSETVAPGPNMPQPSSLRRQIRSDQKTSSSMHFGTSRREDALKQYTVYTYKRW